jgi:hypothetical protein
MHAHAGIHGGDDLTEHRMKYPDDDGSAEQGNTNT